MASSALKVAIIGTGWGVKTQLPAFEAAGWKVGAIWARTPQRVAEIRTSIDAKHVPVITDDYNKILDDPTIDLVSIVTPPSMHAKMAQAALAKKKHVLCDKPTALSSNEALSMVTAARSHKGQLSLLDHELRLLDSYNVLRKMIATKQHIGTLQKIDVKVNYRPQQNLKWNWWHDKTQGGGLLGAIGSHYIDLMSYVSGARIIDVNGLLETRDSFLPDAISGQPRQITSDDYVAFSFAMQKGIQGTMHLELTPDEHTSHRVTFRGTDGVAVMDQLNLSVSSGFAEGETVFQQAESIAPPVIPQNLFAIGTWKYAKQLHGAVAKLKGSSVAGTPVKVANDLLPNAATFEDGLYVQSVLDAMRDSDEIDAKVSVTIPHCDFI